MERLTVAYTCLVLGLKGRFKIKPQSVKNAGAVSKSSMGIIFFAFHFLGGNLRNFFFFGGGV